MVNKLKLYWPMAISFSLMIILGFLVGVIFLNNGIIGGDSSMILLVMFTFLLVVSIYAEMIYFMIKMCKNKEVKNKIIWCIFIYFFHVFIIPYINIKYVCKDNNIKNKMIGFIVLMFVSLLLGISFVSKNNINNNTKVKDLYIIEDEVKVKYKSNFREKEVGDYDFYIKDYGRDINFGGFIYDEDDYETPNDLLDKRDRWIKSSRGPVTVLDSISFDTETSIIHVNIYIGFNDGIRNMYYISTVEFKEKNCFVNVISTYLHEDYLDYKEEIFDMLRNMEYVGEIEL